MIAFDGEPLSVENGIMFGLVEIDGKEIKAGLTLEAFERLIESAGFDPDRERSNITVSDIVELLRPMIEAHLEAKHFRSGGSGVPLIIDVIDLTTH